MDGGRPLSEVEIALMDTLKLVFEVFVAKGISTPETLSEALKRQAAQYSPQNQPASIWVVEQLRAVLDDPERKASRELLERPAQGRG